MESRGEEGNIVQKLFDNCKLETSCNIINKTLQKNSLIVHCKFNITSSEVLRDMSANRQNQYKED